MVTLWIQRKTKGGGNSGEGKTYHKSPPQKWFWTPPLMIRFPPPLCSRNVILLRGNGHRPDKSHFLRPPKLVLEGVLYGTFPPPPPKSHDTFCPALCEFPMDGTLERKTREGCHCRFRRAPCKEGLDKVPGQCRPKVRGRFAFPSARNPQNRLQ